MHKWRVKFQGNELSLDAEEMEAHPGENGVLKFFGPSKELLHVVPIQRVEWCQKSFD